MKIIHFADLHIGSKFNRLPLDIKNELKSKLRNAFSKIIAYAKKNNITTILMSGDIFDKDTVNIDDKKFFYGEIKLNPQIDFYYIKGNHDLNSNYINDFENLHTFDEIKYYEKDNVRIVGYDLKGDNQVLYDYPKLATDKFNIMMLHGDINNNNDTHFIDTKKLFDKNINYFALGHIHKREERDENNCKLVYPGCVMGTGFDETGYKGFIVLDTDANSTTFINLSDIIFEHFELNVNRMDEAKLKDEINKLLGENQSNVITEICLSGKSEYNIDCDDLFRTFKDKRYYLIFKNSSKLVLKYIRKETDNSLTNMFTNIVLNCEDLDDDIKQKVLQYGLSKLQKEDA